MKNFLLSLLAVLCAVTSLSAQSNPRRNYVDIVMTPSHDNWLYNCGEKPTVKISVLKNGVPQKDVVLKWEAGPEMMKPTAKGEEKLSKGEFTLTLPTMKQPGFVVCKVETKVNGYTFKEQVKVGFEPEKIKPTVNMPKDFDAFWSAQLDKVKDVDLDIKKKLNTKYSTDRYSVYEVSFRINKDGHRMSGWLMIPEGEGPFPAVFMPPGAGIKPQIPVTSYVEKGMITFMPDIHGNVMEMNDEEYTAVRTSFGDYMFMNLDDKEKYYYNRIFLGCKRAVDMIYTLPEFNGNIGAAGGSQGGALAMVTTALDPRVKAVVSFFPALCDITGYLHGRAGGWPHMFNEKNGAFMNKPEKVENIAYYDVVNFAKKINVPGFYSFGYNDNVCPPTSVYAAINSVPGEKFILIEPITAHWRFSETTSQSIEWLKYQLYNGL